jgi:hypothetical protein
MGSAGSALSKSAASGSYSHISGDFVGLLGHIAGVPVMRTVAPSMVMTRS